jgi:hypothetical protein
MEDIENTGSFLDVDTSDAVEPIAAEAGEHEIAIVGGVIDKDKNGHPYFLPRFEVVDGPPNVKDFTDFIRLPYEGMTEKEKARADWRLYCFKAAFGLPQTGKINLQEDALGLRGWAILGVKEDPQYGEQNTISKYVTPK